MVEAETLNPEATQTILAYKSMGYSISTAIADIIDNSIAAGAKNVQIETIYQGADSIITIMDDGEGMDADELVRAMSFGSDPNRKRASSDLGRFGLGLKTASFSQCDVLTVISKKNGEIVSRTWDLNYVASNGWKLLKKSLPEIEAKLNSVSSGTVVVWEGLYRIAPGFLSASESDREKYSISLLSIEPHLAMVFHRFIERNKLKIKCFGKKVAPFNPFLPQYENKRFSLGTVSVQGAKVQTWILPSKSLLTQGEITKAANGQSWVSMQGFYIYRADRMLMHSNWMGLKYKGLTLKSEGEYDLARISIDIDNDISTDITWNIDVKKSNAEPPAEIKDALAGIAFQARQKASEVYRSRGAKKERKQAENNFTPLWKGVEVKNGKAKFRINWENSILLSLLSDVDAKTSKRIRNVLRLLEEFLPVEDISAMENKDDRSPLSTPFDGSPEEEVQEIREMINQSYKSKGFSDQEAKNMTDNLIN